MRCRNRYRPTSTLRHATASRSPARAGRGGESTQRQTRQDSKAACCTSRRAPCHLCTPNTRAARPTLELCSGHLSLFSYHSFLAETQRRSLARPNLLLSFSLSAPLFRGTYLYTMPRIEGTARIARSRRMAPLVVVGCSGMAVGWACSELSRHHHQGLLPMASVLPSSVGWKACAPA